MMSIYHQNYSSFPPEWSDIMQLFTSKNGSAIILSRSFYAIIFKNKTTKNARSFHTFEWARKKLRAGKVNCSNRRTIFTPKRFYKDCNSDKMLNSLTSVSCTVIPLNQLKTNAFSHNLVFIQWHSNYFQSLIFYCFWVGERLLRVVITTIGCFCTVSYFFYSIKSIR